jgi:hypothetical protein
MTRVTLLPRPKQVFMIQEMMNENDTIVCDAGYAYGLRVAV